MSAQRSVQRPVHVVDITYRYYRDADHERYIWYLQSVETAIICLSSIPIASLAELFHAPEDAQTYSIGDDDPADRRESSDIITYWSRAGTHFLKHGRSFYVVSFGNRHVYKIHTHKHNGTVQYRSLCYDIMQANLNRLADRDEWTLRLDSKPVDGGLAMISRELQVANLAPFVYSIADKSPIITIFPRDYEQTMPAIVPLEAFVRVCSSLQIRIGDISDNASYEPNCAQFYARLTVDTTSAEMENLAQLITKQRVPIYTTPGLTAACEELGLRLHAV